jgi:thiamine-phosphate pyrophosphorylase
MRLIIISPPDDVPDEPQVVCGVLQQSTAIFHLRKPGQADSRLADYLSRIPAAYHHRIMVHGHPRLLARFDLRGIHFTERERVRHPEGLQRLSQERPGCRLSSAFHRITDIPESDGRFDYIFLSPVFDSISKPGYPAAFDHADLKCVLSRTGHTVIALGGIDGQRIAVAASLGFKGVAVLGAVWGAPVPATAAGILSTACGRMASLPVHKIHGA